MDCNLPGFPALHHRPKLAQTHVHWIGDAIQSSHSLPSPSPPAFSLSQHQGFFQWVDSSHQVAKVLELQHQSFQWIFRVDFLRIDWFDLLAVQGTLKSPLQDHSTKALILPCSAFFTGQISHLYMTNRKTIALTTWTFVRKVMSLLFNMLSRFVIAFLPRSKCFGFLFVCFLFVFVLFCFVFLHFMAAITTRSDFGAQENKVCHCFHFFPIYLPWGAGTMASS